VVLVDLDSGYSDSVEYNAKNLGFAGVARVGGLDLARDLELACVALVVEDLGSAESIVKLVESDSAECIAKGLYWHSAEGVAKVEDVKSAVGIAAEIDDLDSDTWDPSVAIARQSVATDLVVDVNTVLG